MGDVDRPLAPSWLSHHTEDEADRCIRVGDRHVCRRCLAMYAGFFPALALLLSSWRDDLQTGDMGLVLALALLAGAEFVQVARGVMPYSPRRVLVLSPATGALVAWLAVTGFADGIGPVHLAAGAAALALLMVLFVRGTVAGRAV
ncbi:MAG: hypothetical protein U5K30_07675 [Acidimicrobiales bacterium]|nr:hypothetical protein [Acidimicrobiales bacterium]